MTTNTNSTYPLTRRSVLKSAAAAGAVSAFGVTGTGFVGRAAADEHTIINTCNDLDIVLALDYSGSIRSAGTWGDIRSGVESFLDVLPADVQIGLVRFGDSPVAYEYATNDLLRLATASNVTALKGAVPTATPPGENATHMPGALAFADAILDAEGRGGNELVLLVTDGGPNYQNGFVGDGDDDPNTAGFQGPADDETFAYGAFEFTGGTNGGENGVAGEPGEKTETTATADAIKGEGTRIIAVGVGGNVAGFDTYLENEIASSPDDFVAVEDPANLGSQLQALITEVCDECPPCESNDLLAKYEYEYEVDEETGEVLVDTFEPEFETESFSFLSYEGEEGEPMSATFTTDYCSVWAVVKSGQEFEVQGFVDNDGTFTVGTANDEKYAISFVAFYCSEEAAQAAADAFPSNGGRGRGR
jgi:hypothetical protein